MRAISAAALVAGFIALPAGAVVIAPPDGFIINPVSENRITVDGLFTNPGEWSDVVARAFKSGTPAQPVPLGDPSADSLLYAALAPGVAASSVELYLMYDYKSRTDRSYSSGQTIAEIKFPIVMGSATVDLTITLKAPPVDVTFPDPPSPNPAPSSYFVVNFDVNNSQCTVCNDIEVGAAFGPSIDGSGGNHLLVELEVPLNVPAGFFTPGLGLPTGPLDGLYSPAPAFWNASAEKDAGDPPISSAIFQINPDGSTLVCPSPGPCPLPAPAPFWLLGLGLAAMGWSRRGSS